MQSQKEKFIQKAEEKFGKRFDYSHIDYINCKTKVKIICPDHGEFLQTPDSHLQRKIACPDCANNRPKTQEYFITQSIKIHGNKYNYDKVQYIDSQTPITITCPHHGDFKQLPNTHIIQKCGCPKCGAEIASISRTMSTDEFIKKAVKKHGNKFDYSKTKYVDHKTPITIFHKQYGEFTQLPYYHLKNNGFDHPNFPAHNLMDTEEFIKKAKKVHGKKYDYSNVEYIDTKSKVEIICPNHGEFLQSPNVHLMKHGCIHCGYNETNLEKYIENALNNLSIKYIKNNRTKIYPKELDFYLPDHNIAIETNGLRWHGDMYLNDRSYHLTKTNLCKNICINLIHIFEDEINLKSDIVISKLKSILNISKRRIHGRKCEVREIDTKIKSKFLNKYHLQGNDKASVKLGLFYNNRLVSVMTFCKRRVALGKKSSKESEYELSRFCGNFSFYVIGGASKLLKYFERHYNPSKIVTYADKRWSKGDVYFKLGFKHTHDSKPNYWYSRHNNDRIHRFNFRKSELKKKLSKFNPKKTEWENMKENGWDRIWDCGNMVFEKIY